MLNTWDGIIGRLRMVRSAERESERVQLLMELLIGLRLLGQDASIPDRREKKGDIEKIYEDIERETRAMLDTETQPTADFIYYAREVLKKLPVRQGAEEIIEQIRATAEEFEESRSEDDPMLSFAGDLRKEVHRRLSPRIIHQYVEPYLDLVLRGNPEPIVKAGYVALPHFFRAEDEGGHFLHLAQDLLEKLHYLWDYESGNLAVVKRQLEQNMELFERCFLKAEVGGFLRMLTPANLAQPHLELALLKRLASFKHFLKESHRERRISLYDFLLLDLSLGRLVFLLANDLTNNHFAEVTPRNLRDALAVVRELLNISSVKGLAIGDVDQHQAEIDDLRESSVYDFIKAKRRLGAIFNELKRYLQADIIDRMSGPLNRMLQEYEVPTSRLSSIKTRFFNNFIRRTQIHVLSEFMEKVTAAVDDELGRQTEARRLYAGLDAPDAAPEGAPESFVATTWESVDERLRPYLGGKGNSILDMARLGLRVPPAFVLGFPFFSGCAPDGALGDSMARAVLERLAELEARTGRALGDPERPLLVSVRSGAPTSMPGVMATILNVGWCPRVRAALEAGQGVDLSQALYRRFLANCLAALRLATGEAHGARSGIREMEGALTAVFGPEFLDDPRAQLLRCIQLVYGSRASHAVRAYTSAMAADVKPETAVTVQQLVFGNLDDNSLSGVLITRNPITGEDELFGEFKRRAQGEEVVMGSADTEPIQKIDPALADELKRGKDLLVRRFRQVLDLEFTVEGGTLYFLQARAARLGAFAQLVADADFLKDGIIDLDEFRSRVDRLELAFASAALPRADFRARTWNPPLTVGVPINGGVISGTLVLTEGRLQEAEARRESVVFLANSTKPTDFAVMNGAHAIVTVYPGRTSHAAITAMSMNKPCIVGCGDVEIDYERGRAIFRGAGSVALAEGERVTADGNTGALYRGVAPISEFFLPLSSVGAAIADCADARDAARAVRNLIDGALQALRAETNLRRAPLSGVRSFGGRAVLVRSDANVVMREGRIADKGRIARLVPTLEYILEHGGTPVLCSHLGDPGAGAASGMTRERISHEFSLAPVAEALRGMLGERLVFHRTSVAASGLLVSRKDMVPGAVNLLENLRFASGERDNDEGFARSLAELSDGWFVNDAFNVCIRRHASITGAPKFAEHRLAGLQVARELAVLETILDNPPRPFVAVFEGEASEFLSGVMAALAPRVDYLAAVGTQGLERHIDAARTLLWAGRADLGMMEASDGVSADASSAPASEPIVAPHRQALHRAVRRGAFTVICSETERDSEIPDMPSLHVTTGPRAFLEFMERFSLPGITALDPADT